jgi:radical SAM protein with 4Fe4S-binding SPASM domain
LNTKPSHELRFPEKSYRSVRGSQALYYSADSGVAVVANEAGSDVLEACRGGGSVDAIARRLAPDQPAGLSALVELIRPYLFELIELGFLQLDEPQDDVERAAHSETFPIQLAQLYLHATDACNLHCIYCYNAPQRSHRHKKTLGKASSALTTPQVRRLLDEVASLGANEVVFTGGEPLCRGDICELGAYARAKGLATSLLTNGTLIDRPTARRISGSFDSVVVSVDSWVQEEYDFLQPGAPLEQALRGVGNLVDAKVSQVTIRPVISSVNLSSLPRFPSFAAEHLGCCSFLIALYIPNSPAEIDELGLLPEPESYWNTLERFRLEVARLGGTSIADCFPLESSGSCGAGGGVLSVAANGDLYPCQCLHQDEYLLGNVEHQSLSSILESSPELDLFHEEQWPWFSPCSECALLALCASRCRVFHRVFKENEASFYERLCPFFKEEIEDRLWREVGNRLDASAALEV